MAHERFDPEIEELAEDHEEVEVAMQSVVLAYLSGEVTLEEAEARIEEAAENLKEVQADWVEDVMPDVYAEGIREAQRALRASETASEQEIGVEHDERLLFAQRRLLRRLHHAADGLAVDALDRLDEATEQDLDGRLLEASGL